jgi:hypothetical protein
MSGRDRLLASDVLWSGRWSCMVSSPSNAEAPAAAQQQAGPLPAALLPASAAQALRSAFARQVRERLPRILAAARQSERPGLVAARADAEVLAGTCSLLGDAAAARSLRQLGALLGRPTDEMPDPRLCGELADQAALLLGRWVS